MSRSALRLYRGVVARVIGSRTMQDAKARTEVERGEPNRNGADTRRSVAVIAPTEFDSPTTLDTHTRFAVPHVGRS